MSARALAGSQFASHVRVSTPARSYAHGVGNIQAVHERRSLSQPHSSFGRSLPSASETLGYVREKPSIPFDREDIFPRSKSFPAFNANSYRESSIPILPPSPYRVDSPDPESLWPEGLFLPPVYPARIQTSLKRRVDAGSDIEDPYLLEGIKAIAATRRSYLQILYFHNVPHIKSLLANQELRAKNMLKPNRIASIRYTWPYNRP